MITEKKTMKAATLKQIHDHGGKVFESGEPILILRGKEPLGVFEPLPDPSNDPIEVRRRRYSRSIAKIRRHLAARGITEEQVDRDIEATLRKARGRR